MRGLQESHFQPRGRECDLPEWWVGAVKDRTAGTLGSELPISGAAQAEARRPPVRKTMGDSNVEWVEGKEELCCSFQT